MLASIPTVGVISFLAQQNGWGIAEAVQIICFAIIFLLYCQKRFLVPRQRAYLTGVFLLIAALAEVSRYGLATATFPVFAVIPILASVIGGLRVGFGAIAVIVAALSALAWFTIANEAVPPLPFPASFYSVTEWVRHIIVFVLSAAVAVFLTGSLFRFHRNSADDLRGLDEELLKSQARVIQSAKLAGLGYAYWT